MKPPTLPVLALAALLGGCASFSPDGGLDRVAAITRERMAVEARPIHTEADAAGVADEVKRLLAEPLTPDSAARIAVLNHRGLQAELAGLGIAEADLVQAGRLRNPGFSFSRLAGGGETEFERKFLFDLMGLLTLSTRTGIERRRFEAAQLALAGAVLHRAQAARQAWFEAVAARQATRYQDDVVAAAGAGADLARRMAEAGNFSRLRQQREQLFHAEMAADQTRAHLAETAARERLVRALGLSAGQRGFLLPDRLPELPAELQAEPAVVQAALDGRLDLAMAKAELAGLAKGLGLTRATRFVNVLEASYLNSDARGEPHKRGYEIELVLPLFDWGEARTAKAEALYTQAMHRAAGVALDAESEVRAAHAAYRAAFELARRYRDEIVPLGQSISEETLLRYNGMLIGVWELLADARRQVAGVNAAIQARKDFWVAEGKLQMSLNGGGAPGIALTAAAPTAEPAGGH